MRITLTYDQVLKLARQYDTDEDDNRVIEVMQAAVLRGYMTSGDLETIARWKSVRALPLVRANTSAEIGEVTKASFSAKTERLRIYALFALRGVSWPMASVILHFAFPNGYPILDIRAMKTVGSATNYTFEKWCAYTRLCRETIAEMDIDMRTLDKALWQAGG